MHIHHSFWLQKYSLYGLVINVHEIVSHELVPMAQDTRGMETTGTSSINMVGAIMIITKKDQSPLKTAKSDFLGWIP